MNDNAKLKVHLKANMNAEQIHEFIMQILEILHDNISSQCLLQLVACDIDNPPLAEYNDRNWRS